MRILKLLFSFILISTLFVSCVVDPIVDDVYVDQSTTNLEGLLNTFDIWYVDIGRTEGIGEIPFLQKAFTVSFHNGFLSANNNIIGMKNQGNGVKVGYYNTGVMELGIDHDVYGFYDLIVDQISSNEIRLYDSITNTSYYLQGYQRYEFDYDKLFYDNIHFFLQEYETWEKVFTSSFGILNEFDNENFLKFMGDGSVNDFKSSKDLNGSPINYLFYDYIGRYNISNISANFYRKKLTLDYDYLGNEFFELTVVSDNTIELLHQTSGTIYRFVGKGNIQFKRVKKGISKPLIEKNRF